MVLDAAGVSSQSRTRVRTAEDRNLEAGQPWRGWRVDSRSELTSQPVQGSVQGSFPQKFLNHNLTHKMPRIFRQRQPQDRFRWLSANFCIPRDPAAE